MAGQESTLLFYSFASSSAATAAAAAAAFLPRSQLQYVESMGMVENPKMMQTHLQHVQNISESGG